MDTNKHKFWGKRIATTDCTDNTDATNLKIVLRSAVTDRRYRRPFVFISVDLW